MKKNYKKNEISKIAKEVIKKIKFKKPIGATIVALSGELGVGKTALTQEIGKILGIKEKMVSPTFTIIKNYKLRIKNFEITNFFHIDAYRLESSQELINLGWEEISNDPKNLIFIEWPEQVPECILGDVFRIKLEHIDEETRNIQLML